MDLAGQFENENNSFSQLSKYTNSRQGWRDWTETWKDEYLQVKSLYRVCLRTFEI